MEYSGIFFLKYTRPFGKEVWTEISTVFLPSPAAGQPEPPPPPVAKTLFKNSGRPLLHIGVRRRPLGRSLLREAIRIQSSEVWPPPPHRVSYVFAVNQSQTPNPLSILPLQYLTKGKCVQREILRILGAPNPSSQVLRTLNF